MLYVFSVFFVLFDIISATSNSPLLDAIVALILELRKYQSNLFLS